jgi:hypothetical protein
VDLPPFDPAQILAWADAHFQRAGKWPTRYSGPVADAPGHTWCQVDQALLRGQRGLPGGDSVARLLARERGVRNQTNLPRLTEAQILTWADAHYARTGKWPTHSSGPVADAPEETWCGLQMALNRGVRALPGGSSLAQLLARERGRRNRGSLPHFTVEQILTWADAHFQRTGQWPKANSGPIPEASGETWQAVAHALSRGMRGLPGGDSLARLLARGRGVPNLLTLPRISEAP